MSFNISIEGLQILEIVGRGSQGIVYLCSVSKLNTLIALKIINDCSLERELFVLQRLRGCANVVQTLKLPCLPESLRNTCLPLRYYPNGDLFTYLEHFGAFEHRLTKTIMRECLEALRFIHENNVVHRDLKPENIFFDEHFNVVLGDFGLADVIDSSNLHGYVDGARGSHDYVAPEVFDGVAYYGKKADMWSLGCIMFVMIFGFLPFGSSGAIATNWYLNKLRQGKRNLFWEEHMKFSKNSFVSELPQTVIDMMLIVNPLERPDVDRLLSHEYMSVECEIPFLSNEEKQTLFMTLRSQILESGHVLRSEDSMTLSHVVSGN
jgi:serine/threonine protein kinase